VSRPIQRLVLDCHGVVLNDPWPGFLRDCALRAGRTESTWLTRWRSEWRRDAWLGRISDGDLWVALHGGSDTLEDWAGALEPRYAPGPAARWLAEWRDAVPIVLLTNHRASWLRPRLARFDLERYFEQILVSDETGEVKPDEAAFRRAAGACAPSEVLFVDNALRNVRAAADAGLQTMLADRHGGWLAELTDRLLGKGEPCGM
jgi:HAD superfamily hydrolase (TIGR01509 family)